MRLLIALLIALSCTPAHAVEVRDKYNPHTPVVREHKRPPWMAPGRYIAVRRAHR